VTLACDGPEMPIAEELVVRPEVGIVDFTGGSSFGNWIESHATQARVYTEKAGVNSIVLDGTDDMRAMTGNIAFSLCLYSGQMCTTPQNIYIPESGIQTPDGLLSFDDTAAAIVKAVDWFVSDPARAAEVLGAVNSEATMERVSEAATSGAAVLRRSAPIENERFPAARTATPLIMQMDAADTEVYQREIFGPVTCIVRTTDTAESIALAASTARTRGGLTAAVWSTNHEVLDQATEALTDAGVSTSCNLTGQIWMNQSAAFSDYHGSGVNPAGNASLCDAAFVADRFRFVASRVPVVAPVEEPVA
jgi:phenylacetic acid degradation protein paaN